MPRGDTRTRRALAYQHAAQATTGQDGGRGEAVGGPSTGALRGLLRRADAAVAAEHLTDEFGEVVRWSRSEARSADARRHSAAPARGDNEWRKQAVGGAVAEDCIADRGDLDGSLRPLDDQRAPQFVELAAPEDRLAGGFGDSDVRGVAAWQHGHELVGEGLTDPARQLLGVEQGNEQASQGSLGLLKRGAHERDGMCTPLAVQAAREARRSQADEGRGGRLLITDGACRTRFIGDFALEVGEAVFFSRRVDVRGAPRPVWTVTPGGGVTESSPPFGPTLGHPDRS